MNAAVVWEHGPLRIVAAGGEGGSLKVEHREHDALGAERWEPLLGCGDNDQLGIEALAIEIVSKIEVLPEWVRSQVAEHRDLIGEQDALDDVPDVCPHCGEEHEHDHGPPTGPRNAS